MVAVSAAQDVLPTFWQGVQVVLLDVTGRGVAHIQNAVAQYSQVVAHLSLDLHIFPESLRH